MNNYLKTMLVGVGLFALGGVAVKVYTPQPATRSMAELRDAGIAEGQSLVVECPERITKQMRRRIEANQPGILRPSQGYAHIARTARCFNPDGGVCFRASDGLPRVADEEAELVIASLRRDLAGIDTDAGVGSDDGGDSDDVDDSFQYRVDACELFTCPQYDAMVDAGTRTNPFSNRFCANLNRLMVVPSPCMIPDARLEDGGWDDNAPAGAIDCLFTGPYGLPDGGPRWNGVNVRPREYAVGSQCLPVECSVVAGDIPHEWL